jgi:hypothetical protein
MTMAKDTKTPKPKAEPAPKSEATPAKEKSPSGETAAKTESSESAGGAAPANYSRGEGQKPVSAAYRENWNAIFAKKKKRKGR